MERKNQNGLAEKIGQNITQLREKRRISAVDLAKTLSASENRILQFEKGLERPSPEELLAISEALNVKVSQILEDVE